MKHTTMLTTIENLVMQRAETSLSDLQRAILIDCWQDPRITYEAIANKHGYSVKYIKQDVGPKLWKLLSIICSKKVKKNNFKSIIEGLVVNNQDCNDRDRHNSSFYREKAIWSGTSDTNYSLKPKTAIAPMVRSHNAVNLTEAPDTRVFFGRTKEIEILRQWSSPESVNLITILGMGGIGKTHLTAKLVQEVKHNYDYIFWRSLTYNASYEEFMVELLSFLAQDSASCIPTNEREQLDILINYLRQNCCLIVLDNLETVLAHYQIGSSYRAGYEKYSKLLQIISQYNHRSLLIITSREKPREINVKQDLKVHCYYLSGLEKNAGRQLLQSSGCMWNLETHCDYLLTQYAGNPLALKIASSTIQYLFEGDLSSFIERETFVLSGISTLLAQQIERLSRSCKTLVYWLAILVDLTSFNDLKDCCYPAISNHDLIESLETLLRRGIIEKKGAAYKLQPMIQEYLTEQIIKICHQEILDLAFSPDGNLLASGSSDCTVVIWDLKRNCLVRKLDGQGQRIRCVVFSPCGKFLATSSSDHRIELWSVATGICLQTLSGHTNHVWSVAFNFDGTIIASGSEDRTIKLWSVATGRCIKSFRHKKWIRSIAFHPQENVLVSGGGNCTIELWDLSRDECIKSLTGHTQRIRSVAFSPDGQTIASGSGDNTIRFWNYQTGECERVLYGHSSRLTALSFSPRGKILASGGEDKSIRLWHVSTGKIVQTWQGYSSWFQSVGFSPDGKSLVSGSENHQIEIWDLDRLPNPRLKLVGHQGWVCQVAFSRGQDKIVSCSSDRTIKLWNRDTGICLKTLRGHSHQIRSVAFSPSGKMLVSGGGDRVVKILDITQADCQQSLFGHQGWISTVVFSPDETMIASGSEDKNNLSLEYIPTKTSQDLKRTHKLGTVGSI